MVVGGRDIKFTSTNKTFTGIGGVGQRALCEAHLPTDLGLPIWDSVTLSMDVIGGEGSACPGLVPLTTLMRLRAGILCGAFPNIDGVMIINVTLLDSSHRQQDFTFFCHLFFH